MKKLPVKDNVLKVGFDVTGILLSSGDVKISIERSSFDRIRKIMDAYDVFVNAVHGDS